jgi:hypothetical protein
MNRVFFVAEGGISRPEHTKRFWVISLLRNKFGCVIARARARSARSRLISLNRPRPLSSRHAGQTPRVASSELFAPHPPQTAVADFI